MTATAHTHAPDGEEFLIQSSACDWENTALLLHVINTCVDEQAPAFKCFDSLWLYNVKFKTHPSSRKIVFYKLFNW